MNKKYRKMEHLMIRINRALKNCTCPVCGQPAGVWQDGEPRITCGGDKCYMAWLKPGQDSEEGAADES